MSLLETKDYCLLFYMLETKDYCILFYMLEMKNILNKKGLPVFSFQEIEWNLI